MIVLDSCRIQSVSISYRIDSYRLYPGIGVESDSDVDTVSIVLEYSCTAGMEHIDSIHIDSGTAS